MNDEIWKLADVPKTPEQGQPPRRNWLKILGIVVFASTVSTLVALWAVYAYLFPGSFTPVTLSSGEQ
ncbi:MAG: hypothetical protein GQ530_04915 [Desulfuromonadales bacterium]|nr:hypothetical protein [Desulfuromonadales bacterium]